MDPLSYLAAFAIYFWAVMLFLVMCWPHARRDGARGIALAATGALLWPLMVLVLIFKPGVRDDG